MITCCTCTFGFGGGLALIRYPEEKKIFAAQNDNLPGLAARLDSQYGIVIGTKEMFYSRFVKLF